MPTTDIAGLLSLTSVGPLTTTFTAPDSCETAWKNGQAIIGGIAMPNGRWEALATLGSDCGPVHLATECFPHGSALASIASSSIEDGGLYQTTTVQPYYSPASICPAGWTTVGVAAAGEETVSISGVFERLNFGQRDDDDDAASSSAPETTPFPQVNWPANMLTSALGPQETAVLCCPSGWDPVPFGGRCTTSFAPSEAASSSACLSLTPSPQTVSLDWVTVTSTWEFAGETTTHEIGIGVAPTDLFVGNPTATFVLDEQGGLPEDLGDVSESIGEFVEEAAVEEFEGRGLVDMMVLISNGTNGSNSTGDGDDHGDDHGEDGDGDGDGDSDEPAAAPRGHISVAAVGCALLVGLAGVAAL